MAAGNSHFKEGKLATSLDLMIRCAAAAMHKKWGGYNPPQKGQNTEIR
jgi:hypothetical protein